jgi:hypothetical protein
MGSFLLNTTAAHIFGLLFSSVKFMHSFREKMGWATFLAILSQTQQVALLRTPPTSAQSGLPEAHS